MSLTKELKNPGSAISKWLDNNFDLDAPIHQLERQARGVGTIKPEGNLRDYPWSVVGSAVEFRIRQYCGIEYYSTTAALGGAVSLCFCQVNSGTFFGIGFFEKLGSAR